MDKEDLFEMMEKAILEGDNELACQGAREAIEQGIDPLEVVDMGLSKGMTAVGDRFEQGDAFLPELLMAADPPSAGGGDSRISWVETCAPKSRPRARNLPSGGWSSLPRSKATSMILARISSRRSWIRAGSRWWIWGSMPPV